ncbi:MAG: SDR family oxidoreductase [Acidobacteriota bacterium]
MNKVIFITGASSGIGRETVRLFQAKNWAVAATMRDTAAGEDLQRIADVETFRVDVTEPASIRAAIDAALEKFGRIDAVLNNAGYGLFGPFEAATTEQIHAQFETNVFGVMNVCREILPYFREQKRGTIANVSSVGGRMTFPFSSLYHATKWAVEGFSESLQYELGQFNIRVKIIEPGPIKTDFYGRSQIVTRKEGLTVYDHWFDRTAVNFQKAGESAPDGAVVAQMIYDAVTDGSKRLRYGVNTRGILAARRMLPDRLFMPIIKRLLMK